MRAALLLVATAALSAVATASSASSEHDGEVGEGGRIVQSLFRFPAARLGSEFADLLRQWQIGYLHANETSVTSSGLPVITPEQAGIAHALQSVSTDAATVFRRQCYGNYPTRPGLRDAYRNFEQRRKAISFEYLKDPFEEMEKMHTATKRSYGAFLTEDATDTGTGTERVHKKRSKSTADTIHAQSTLPPGFDDPSTLAFQTYAAVEKEDPDAQPTQRWSWHPPAYFTSRGTSDIPFRKNMFRRMRQSLQTRIQQLLPQWKGFEYGRQSGLFWYPPGAVREWHSNYLDLVGNMQGGGSTKEESIFATQVWRMYAVRTVRDAAFDATLAKVRKGGVDGSNNDHSGMHIIPGEEKGITLEVLQKAGARPLNEDENMRRYADEFAEDYPIPAEQETGSTGEGKLDRNAVWRIPDQDGYVTLFRLPELWHCIVSEEVHRYSLGFAFSDNEVQALLQLAGVEFDREGESAHARDEL